MYWLIQSGFSDLGVESLIKSLESLDIPYSMVDSKAFGGGVDIPVELPSKDIMFYGGYSLTKYAAEQGWTGCFMNDNFNVETWKQTYGTDLLNYDSVTLKLGELNPDMTEFFIRPLEDTKSISGQIMTKDEFVYWKEKVLNIPDDCYKTIDKDTMFTVSSLKDILVEYRFLIVNNKIVTQSEYKRGHRVAYYEDVCDYVKEFVQIMISKWEPAKAYCLDVAELRDGSLKVLELNNINSCGLYACDTQKLVYVLDNVFSEEK